MNPLVGQRWYEVWPQRIAWYLLTAGILGLLLLILLLSVRTLGEATPTVDAAPPARAAIPVDVEPAQPRARRSSVNLPGVVEPATRAASGFGSTGSLRARTCSCVDSTS